VGAADHIVPSASQGTIPIRGSGSVCLWLERPRRRLIFREMETVVQCSCGAEYKRTETMFLVPHTGDALCTVCGAALESWWTSTHVPSFELVKRPDRKPV
jgi:hypothetical protein